MFFFFVENLGYNIWFYFTWATDFLNMDIEDVGRNAVVVYMILLVKMSTKMYLLV